MLDKTKVLVADDDPIKRRSVVKDCLRWGFEVVEAEDADEAIREAAEHRPFAVLLDGKMPEEGDGERAADTIRALLPGVLIISISATRHFGKVSYLRGGRAGIREALEEASQP